MAETGPSLRQRQGKDKLGARSYLAVRGDITAVALDDLLAIREPDAAGLVLRIAVQPRKRPKDLFNIFFFEPDSVVLHGNFAKPLVQVSALNGDDRIQLRPA